MPVTASSELRAGVAVRQHKQDGVHTSRIPGLATSTKGTLLAIYDARYESHAIYKAYGYLSESQYRRRANLATYASSPGHERLGRIT